MIFLSLSERFDARLHGAGINDEENAGQRNNTDERHIGRQRFGLSRRTVGATSRSGENKAYGSVGRSSNSLCIGLERTTTHCSRNLGNPCAEKGMHTRSQQIFLAGAGWVGSAPMLMRGMQPWPSVCIPIFLEAGRPACKCETLPIWGG